MQKESLRKILIGIRSKKMSVKQGMKLLRQLPYVNLKFARLDVHRALRRGFPEVIFAEGKTLAQIEQIVRVIVAK